MLQSHDMLPQTINEPFRLVVVPANRLQGAVLQDSMGCSQMGMLTSRASISACYLYAARPCGRCVGNCDGSLLALWPKNPLWCGALQMVTQSSLADKDIGMSHHARNYKCASWSHGLQSVGMHQI